MNCEVADALRVGPWSYDYARESFVPPDTPWPYGDGGPLPAPAGSLGAWLASVHEDDRDLVFQAFSGAAAHGGPILVEYRVEGMNGRDVWLQSQGHVVERARDGRALRSAGLTIDISQVRRQRRHLAAQQAFNRIRADLIDIASAAAEFLEALSVFDEFDACAVFWREADGDFSLLARRGVDSVLEDFDAWLPAVGGAVERGTRWCRCIDCMPACEATKPGQQALDQGLELGSRVLLPVLVGGQVRGLLSLASQRVRRQAQDTVEVLESLADQFGHAVERLLAEQRAASQQRNLTGLFRAMRDFVFVADTGGRILSVNPAMESSLGYGDQVIGMSVLDLHPARFRTDAERIFGEMVAGNTEICPLSLLRADGVEINVDTRIVRGEWDGKPVMLGISRDMTTFREQHAALRRADEQLRRLMDCSRDGILILDNDFSIIDANQRQADMLGYALDEVIGLSVWQIDALAGEAEIRSRFPDLSRVNVTFETQHRRKDGTIYDAEVSATGTVLADGTAASLCITRDITDRKHADTALRDGEARFRSLFENMTQGVFYQAADGKLIDINQAACRLLGLDRDAFLDLTCTSPKWEVLDDRGEPMAADRHPSLVALRTGRPVLDETLAVRSARTGDWVWMQVNAIPEFRRGEERPFRVFVTLQDVTARREAASALAESEQRLSALLRQAADGIVLIDAATLRFSEFNDAACGQLGYTRDEFVALDLPMVNPDMDVTVVWQKIQEILKVGALDFETTHRHKDGTSRAVRVTNRPVHTGGRNYIVAIWTDITLQKQQRARLDETMAFLRESQAIAKVGGWKANPATDRLLWTEEVYRLVEHPLDRPPQGLEEGLRYYAPESLPTVRAALAHTLETGEPFRLECRMLTGTGRDFWAELRCIGRVDDPVEGTYLTGTFQDITERRDAMRALREAEARWKFALEGSGLGVWDVNLETGETFLSPQWKAMVGYRDDEWVGGYDAWLDLLHPDDREPVQRRMNDYLDGSAADYLIEFRMRHKQGRWLWVQSRGQIITRDEQDRPLRIIGVHIDIDTAKRAEDVRQELINRLGNIIEATRSGTWEWNVQTDETVFNAFWAEMLGYTLGELEPLSIRTWLEKAHPEDLQHSSRMLQEHFAGQSPYYESEVRMRHKDGRWIWILDRGKVTEWTVDGQPLRMFGTHHDISERKRIEIELQRSEDNLKRAQRVAQVGSWYLDVASGVLEWSDETYRIFGMTIGSPIDLERFLACVHPDDRQMVGDSWSAALNGAPYDIEHRILVHGATRWVREQAEVRFGADGGPLSGLGAVQDVTERKQADQARHESEQRFRAIADSAPALIWVAGADQDLTFVSRVWLQFTGASAGQALGRGWMDFVHPDDLASCVDTRVQAYASRRAFTAEYRLRRHDGCYRWMIENGCPRFGYEGVFLGFIGSCVDITERVEMEQRLGETTRRAEDASRAKSDFLATMSHEIRTPMNAIIGLTSLVLESELTPRQRDHLERVQSSSKALLRLLNDILDYAKIESGRLDMEQAPFDLSEVLADVGELFAIRIHEKGLVFRVDIDRSLDFPLIGDSLRLSQIFINLIGNAVKFTESGEIAIRVRLVARQADEVTIESVVRDTGIGIAPEQIERLFVSFAQADASITRRYGGTGLGLSITRNLVELMGGQIKADSTPGRGSVFTFTTRFRRAVADGVEYSFPSVSAAAIERAESMQQICAPIRGARILVVDDDEFNHTVARGLLARFGLQTEHARSGPEAMDLVTQRHFDAILMDVQMPGMDGHEVTRELRHRLGAACPPIIALTAGAMDEHRDACLAAGMVDWVTKPIHGQRLAESLVSCISRERIHASSPIRACNTSELADLRVRVGELIGLLAANRLAAKSVAEAITGALAGTELAESFRPVGEATKRLRFKAALKACEAFSSEHFPVT